MVEEIAPDLFQIKIPIPNSPLKNLNSYVIKGPERNLMIDTGPNLAESVSTMWKAIETLKIDLTVTDFFITHLHADHLGMIDELAVNGKSQVYFNRHEVKLFGGDFGVGAMIDASIRAGFPAAELKGLGFKPEMIYGSNWTPDFIKIKEGDIISCGNYEFRCVETPGHTIGHICLYEPKSKFLVSGDHILKDISPNILLWSEDQNPLADYLTSLAKVAGLEVELVLPGHRMVFADCEGRIEEIRQHHHKRIIETLDIVCSKQRVTAYQVASYMNWDLKFSNWMELPIAQRWFATGEANAHLKYLEEQDRVKKTLNQDVLYYHCPG